MPLKTHPKPPPDQIPSTPLTVLVPKPVVSTGPFYVHFSALAEDGTMGDSTDAEIDALAQIITNAYFEWLQQSPTSESLPHDK